MPDLLATFEIPCDSGAAQDTVTNTFAFSMPAGFDPAGAAGGNLLDAVKNFYADTQVAIGQVHNLAYYLSPYLNPAQCIASLYDITGKLGINPATGKVYPHGSPAKSTVYNIGAASGSLPLPHQIAACLTLRGVGALSYPVETPDGTDPGTKVDRPRQRHTGRIYVGPLDVIAIEASGGKPQLYGQFRSDVLLSAQGLKNAAVALGGQWCVWSRSEAFLHTIDRVEIDEKADTVRRRGIRSTTRTGRNL